MTTEPLTTRWPVHGPDEIEAVGDILRGGSVGCAPSSALSNYWSGRENTAFETEWAQTVGLPHAFTVSSGTAGLEAAIHALCDGIDADGRWRYEVLIPARTFIACASAVVRQGLRPVLADIDADSLCVTPETLEAACTGATVGVMIVHYAGLPCPRMDDLVCWAMKRGLWILEDCSHAHGAPVGKQSHIAVWSMCYGKIISSGGEGGVVACLDDGLAEKVRAYRDFGRYQMTGRMAHGGPVGLRYQYLCQDFGTNIRLTEMQAVLARFQLRGLARQVERRREIAAAYDDVLGSAAMHTPELRAMHARYMYLLQVGERDAVMQALVDRGIPARVGGTPSLAHEPAFAAWGWVYETPVADAVGARTLGLPVYPTMSDADVTRVCDALREVLG